MRFAPEEELESNGVLPPLVNQSGAETSCPTQLKVAERANNTVVEQKSLDKSSHLCDADLSGEAALLSVVDLEHQQGAGAKSSCSWCIGPVQGPDGPVRILKRPNTAAAHVPKSDVTSNFLDVGRCGRPLARLGVDVGSVDGGNLSLGTGEV